MTVSIRGFCPSRPLAAPLKSNDGSQCCFLMDIAIGNIRCETNRQRLYSIMKKIAYSKAAVKALRKMQQKRAAAIVAKVEAFANGETVDLKKLQGSEFFRIRVGQDRVIIDDQTMQVLVVKAGPRGDVYNE
nr:hypothetical protein [Rhizobium sp. CIAT894]